VVVVNTRPLAIAGAYEMIPEIHPGKDGRFVESMHFHDVPDAAAPTRLCVAYSSRDTVKGIHYAPGMAKYVTCVRGEVLDVVVDLRPDSPTFGRWDGLYLDDEAHRSVYIGAGLGHGYCVLSPDAVVVYLFPRPYDPDVERGIDPLDADLAIDWPVEAPSLSERDLVAPSLAQALARGLL
jgi:dTDP-4-dehydrorhamnose 3,5-epimerase